jgi:hypothetical protein
MKAFVKNYWKVLLFFTVVGLIGGFFTGFYALDSYPEEMRQELLSQGLTEALLAAISAIQSAGYGLILGAIGIVLAKKVGLWRDALTFAKKPLCITVVWAVIGGLCLILPDLWFFGNYEPMIRESYAVKPTVPYLLATVTYGAVIEEVMLRLFMMSLIAFLLHKLFERGKTETSVAVLIAANMISALLFAAEHLPATDMLFGLTPMIVVRCFLLNGGFGLLFGWLYRKYGLQYAMIAHGGCHVVSKLIWILFV